MRFDRHRRRAERLVDELGTLTLFDVIGVQDDGQRAELSTFTPETYRN
ncbi:hypothetical protein ACUXZZ_43990 [Streptomyces graminifolii]